MLNCKIEVVLILAWLYIILFKESKVWLAENACFGSARKWHFHLQDFDKVNGCIRTHFPGPVFFLFFKKSLAALCVHMCACVCLCMLGPENYVGYLLLSLSTWFLFGAGQGLSLSWELLASDLQASTHLHLSSTRIKVVYFHTWPFTQGLETQRHVLRLAWQTLCQLSHLPRLSVSYIWHYRT